MSVTLPVSLGEALDKLSILDIKLRKITDHRKADVEHEYNLLFNELKSYIVQYDFYYKHLIKVNEEIWNNQDTIRSVTADSSNYVDLCKNILDKNDMRFRIKNKINLLANSEIKEQKGYPLKKALFFGHMGMGDIINNIGAIRYFSLLYDELIIAGYDMYFDRIKMLVGNDPSIKVTSFKPMEHCRYPELMEIAKNEDCDLIAAGQWKSNYTLSGGIPYTFYHDFGLPVSVHKDFFYIPEYPEQQQYLDKILEHTDRIVFTQLQGGGREIPYTPERSDDVFYCDPVISHYQPGHKYYDLAKELVGLPLVFYNKIIEYAEEIYVIDSSFSCFAGLLDTSKAGNKRTMFIGVKDNNTYPISPGAMEGFIIVYYKA